MVCFLFFIAVGRVLYTAISKGVPLFLAMSKLETGIMALPSHVYRALRTVVLCDYWKCLRYMRSAFARTNGVQALHHPSCCDL